MFKPETKLLIVDDMLTMRKIVGKHCKDMGFTNLTEADDGSTAWEALQHATSIGAPFQLVLSDWNMPKTTGLNLLRMCREDKTYNDVPFMLITAESEKSQVIEAVKAKVSNYIVKPF